MHEKSYPFLIAYMRSASKQLPTSLHPSLFGTLLVQDQN